MAFSKPHSIRIRCQKCNGWAYRDLVEPDEFHCMWCGHRVTPIRAAGQVGQQQQQREAA